MCLRFPSAIFDRGHDKPALSDDGYATAQSRREVDIFKTSSQKTSLPDRQAGVSFVKRFFGGKDLGEGPDGMGTAFQAAQFVSIQKGPET